MNKKIQPKAKK